MVDELNVYDLEFMSMDKMVVSRQLCKSTAGEEDGAGV